MRVRAKSFLINNLIILWLSCSFCLQSGRRTSGWCTTSSRRESPIAPTRHRADAALLAAPAARQHSTRCRAARGATGLHSSRGRPIHFLRTRHRACAYGALPRHNGERSRRRPSVIRSKRTSFGSWPANIIRMDILRINCCKRVRVPFLKWVAESVARFCEIVNE